MRFTFLKIVFCAAPFFAVAYALWTWRNADKAVGAARVTFMTLGAALLASADPMVDPLSYAAVRRYGALYQAVTIAGLSVLCSLGVLAIEWGLVTLSRSRRPPGP